MPMWREKNTQNEDNQKEGKETKIDEKTIQLEGLASILIDKNTN